MPRWPPGGSSDFLRHARLKPHPTSLPLCDALPSAEPRHGKPDRDGASIAARIPSVEGLTARSLAACVPSVARR